MRILDIDIIEAISYLLFSVATGWTVAWIRHLVSANFDGWRSKILLIATLGIIGFLYARTTFIWIHEFHILLMFSILLGCIVLLLIRIRLRMQGTFMNDVREDSIGRMKLVNSVLSQAVDKPRPTRTNTWVFRNSPYLFRVRSAERRLAGAAVKALFRNPSHRMLYLQFTGACILAMLVPPILIKCVVLMAVYTLLTYWHYRYWVNFLHDEWIVLLPWSDEVTFRAQRIAIRTMLLPFAVVMAITFCISGLGQGWGLLFILPLVMILYGMTNFILTFMSLSSHDK
ncbi:Bacterial ABC transporter protein EcsB [compost metagenome]